MLLAAMAMALGIILLFYYVHLFARSFALGRNLCNIDFSPAIKRKLSWIKVEAAACTCE